MSEDLLYKSGGVSVSKYLIKVWDTSYSINNIDSVGIGKQNTNSYWMGAIVSLIALIFFVFDLNKSHSTFVGMSIYDILPTLFSLIFTLAFLYMAIKPKYYLKIRTSGSDSRVLESRDYSDLGPIKFAIENAIISRS